MKANLTLGANVCFRLVDPATGRVDTEVWVRNMTLTVGKRDLLSASAGHGLKDYSVISVGTGTVAPSAGDTGLTAELIRGGGTMTNPTPDTLKTEISFTAGSATGTVTEGGLSLAEGSSDASGSVSAVVNSGQFTIGGIGAASGTYSGGTVEFTSGANAGLTGSISSHTLSSGNAALVLSTAMPFPVVIGDGATLRPTGGMPAMLCKALAGTSVVWDSTHNLVVTWTLSLT